MIHHFQSRGCNVMGTVSGSCLCQYLCHRVISRPATIHSSTIRYISRYSCHYMIHNMIRCITTKLEGYCLVSCSWAQKSVQLTSLVGSMHVFVVSTILKYNAKHCSAWIFLISLFGKSTCIRTKKWKEGEH